MAPTWNIRDPHSRRGRSSNRWYISHGSEILGLLLIHKLDLDKQRSSGRKPLMGGSLFSQPGNSIPTELQPLAPLQTTSSKANSISTAATSNANTEYDKLMDPNTPVPTPPVHAARLSALLKTLANAEGAVAESIKAREALITGLEKILEMNKSTLAKEKTQFAQTTDRKNSIETKKREVEDGIMRGLSAEEPSHVYGNGNSHDDDADRPDVEALTPPPVESLTPTGSPKREPVPEPSAEPVPQQPLPPSSYAPPPSISPPASIAAPLSILSSLTVPSAPVQNRQQNSQSPTNGTGPSNMKKRKMSHPEDEFETFKGEDAMADLDADVAELLRQESGGRL
jgi:regulator of Ty1 transposition protein 103